MNRPESSSQTSCLATVSGSVFVPAKCILDLGWRAQRRVRMEGRTEG